MARARKGPNAPTAEVEGSLLSVTIEVQLADAVKGGEISGANVAIANNPRVRSSGHTHWALTQCRIFAGMLPGYNIILVQKMGCVNRPK